VMADEDGDPRAICAQLRRGRPRRVARRPAGTGRSPRW
jgi:hypothetical protein